MEPPYSETSTASPYSATAYPQYPPPMNTAPQQYPSEPLTTPYPYAPPPPQPQSIPMQPVTVMQPQVTVVSGGLNQIACEFCRTNAAVNRCSNCSRFGCPACLSEFYAGKRRGHVLMCEECKIKMRKAQKVFLAIGCGLMLFFIILVASVMLGVTLGTRKPSPPWP